jgi:membrane protease YdiL (CAAX protease family)
MSAMTNATSHFRTALLTGWAVLVAAGLSYARIRDIPGWAAFPALAAFLLVFPFYLVPAFPKIRERLTGWRLPLFVTGGMTLPYLACCAGAIPFQWMGLLKLAALGIAVGAWYQVLPRAWYSDIGLGGLIAWVMIGHYFNPIYPEPYPKLELSVLGKVGLVPAVALALMVGRKVPETGYGFIPTWREWRIGGINFIYFLIIGLPLAVVLHVFQPAAPKPIWQFVGNFLGYLWVLSLFEEFLFRGVLQPMMENWMRSRALGLLITSVIFGSVHLPYRDFPNWRLMLVAAILGWFCGRARNQAGSIKAAMITHALVVTVQRGFFG